MFRLVCHLRGSSFMQRHIGHQPNEVVLVISNNNHSLTTVADASYICTQPSIKSPTFNMMNV